MPIHHHSPLFLLLLLFLHRPLGVPVSVSDIYLVQLWARQVNFHSFFGIASLCESPALLNPPEDLFCEVVLVNPSNRARTAVLLSASYNIPISAGAAPTGDHSVGSQRFSLLDPIDKIGARETWIEEKCNGFPQPNEMDQQRCVIYYQRQILEFISYPLLIKILAEKWSCTTTGRRVTSRGGCGELWKKWCEWTCWASWMTPWPGRLKSAWNRRRKTDADRN